MKWDFLRRLFDRQHGKENDWSYSRKYDTPASTDWGLMGCVLALVIIGLVMVFSATISLSDSPKYRTTPSFFLIRQFTFAVIGIVAAYITFRMPMRTWQRMSLVLGGLSIVSLILVIVPGIGHEVNGSVRWIRMGPVNVQVSEIVKFAAVIVAAQFTVSRQFFMHSLTGMFPIFMYVAVVAGLLSYQPDLGATAVFCCIVVGIAVLGGLSMRIIVPISAMLAVSAGVAIITSPWRMGRVFAYLNPWDAENQLGKAYQLTHSLIAFGRGELFGVGLGASVEKMHYLPEAHTDFILAVIGEEFGLVGVTVVLLLFYWLIRRAFEIGRMAIRLDQFFSGLVAQGIGIWIGVQVIINTGVATGLFPTKGLTLPLVSYGGSSLVITFCALALLFRVDYENRQLMYGKRSRK